MLVECYDERGAEVYEIIIKQIFQDLVLGASVDDLKAYVNPDDPDDGYMSIEYKDRIYIPYGVLDGKLGGTDVGECLGYIVQDGEVVESSRVFTLSQDPDYNFLVDLNAEGFMDVPMFYRAIDTKGQDIDIPGYIYDQGYEVWK